MLGQLLILLLLLTTLEALQIIFTQKYDRVLLFVPRRGTLVALPTAPKQSREPQLLQHLTFRNGPTGRPGRGQVVQTVGGVLLLLDGVHQLLQLGPVGVVVDDARKIVAVELAKLEHGLDGGVQEHPLLAVEPERTLGELELRRRVQLGQR
uniref:(northern house mosquito) hypothetical protein n=1 Tax=Culex pipiens TaxID=7175 RepID=A0A8D8CZU2_CULPI